AGKFFSQSMEVSSPQSQPDRSAFLHQDFGAGNVYVHNENFSLMVIDWAPPFTVWKEEAFGSPYQDLSPFLATFSARFPGSRGVPTKYLKKLLIAFLEGYVKESGRALELKKLAAMIVRGRLKQSALNARRYGFKGLVIDLYRVPAFIRVVMFLL